MQYEAHAISIIIPVGPGRSAATALESLRVAGLGSGDEVIVVGDGHLPVLDAGLVAGLPVRVLQTPVRGGANAARNLGAESAAHPWLAFLDDDDGYLPDALRWVRGALASDPEAVAWSLFWRIASGRRQWFARRPNVMNERAIWKRNVAGGCSSMVVQRDALAAVGGFDAALPAMQDWDVWLRLARHGRVRTLARPCVLYNDHAGPRISTNTTARVAGFEQLLEKHAADWPERVIGFHRARLAAWRYRAGIGSLSAIFQPSAPFASLLFALQSMRAGRQVT